MDYKINAHIRQSGMELANLEIVLAVAFERAGNARNTRRAMRVRITTSTGAKTTTIRIEGWLGALETAELLGECRSADQPLRLNLKGLISMDDTGIRALRGLQEEGAELIGASPYVQQLLNTSAGAPESAGSE